MPYDKPEKPIAKVTPPEETKTPRYDYQAEDARSFSLQFSPIGRNPERDAKDIGCELKIS